MKLQERGWAEVAAEGSRGTRTWAATDAGRGELRRWLLEPGPNRHQRNPTALRWFLAARLEGEDRREVLTRELAHVEAETERLRAIAEDTDIGGRPAWFRGTVGLGLGINAVMARWLSEQIDTLEAGGDAR